MQRERALLTWRLLVEEVPTASELGEQLQDAILEFRPAEFIVTIIQDAFHDSSTATLLKRGTDLLKFLRWSRQTSGISAFPVLEKKAYSYIKQIIDSKAAPTQPSSFRSALAFAGGTIKMLGALEASKSGRIIGATNQHKLTKKPRKFAKRLTTDMVRILEHAAISGIEPEDRIAAGYFCFMLHGRIRKHDLMFAEKLFLDIDEHEDGYLEAAASRVKTARTTELKMLLMPLLAPVQGLLAESWAIPWMKERVVQGIDAFQCRLPALGIDGKFYDHPCDSSTASRWLRKLLIDHGISPAETNEVTVHGLKATSLSWMSKFGMPLQDRQLLGRHVPSHMSSALTYSRDELSEPMRKYEEVLSQIRSGEFDPDATRSKLRPKKPKLDSGEKGSRSSLAPLLAGSKLSNLIPQEEAPTLVGSDSDSNSSSSSDSSSSSVDETEIPAPYLRSLEELDRVALVNKLYVCRASSLLHRRVPEIDSAESTAGPPKAMLACGKALTRSFFRVKPNVAVDYTGCQRCFKP